MDIHLTINGEARTLDVTPGERLMTALRRAGLFGVKHGCETGECGACAVLVNGEPTLTCVQLAAQAEGASVTTIEGVGEAPEPGWKPSRGLHPIQQAFIDTGAIQCGYCTPAMILVAQALLEKQPRPTEAEVREALSGVLCRCTGYKKPVEAILRAAAMLRGEPVPPIQGGPEPKDELLDSPLRPSDSPAPTRRGTPGETETLAPPRPLLAMTPMPSEPAPPPLKVVGKPERKVDAPKLAQGKPAFADDVEMRGMLVAKVLWSPVAHAWINRIDTEKARALPGVHAVLTYADIPRVVYSTAGQSDPTGFEGSLLDVPRIMVPGLPAGTVIVGRKDRFEYYEQRIGLFLGEKLREPLLHLGQHHTGKRVPLQFSQPHPEAVERPQPRHVVV